MKVKCCECGIIFAVPQSYHELRFRDGKPFHCPNGHGNRYPQSDKPETLKDKLDAANEEIARLKIDKTRLLHQLEQLEAELSKGK